MRTSKLMRGLGAVALVSGMSLTLAPAASAAESEVSGTVPFQCSMPDFGPSADFTYDADVTVKALRDTEGSSPVTLVATMSDMPGVVPAFISMRDQPVTVTLGVTADGSSVELKTSGTTDVNPSGAVDPIELPENIQGQLESTADDFDVAVNSFAFNVAGVGGTCTVSAFSLGVVTPELGEAPEPEPEPEEPTPDPTPTDEPSDEPKGDVEGSPAEGVIEFACVLSPPFNTEFDYNADVSVSGARADAGDSKVNLAATFTELPGLAPVPIDNGKMRIMVDGTVDGEAVSFTGNSTVNAGPNASVPVPRLTATVETEADEAEVLIDTFRFEFDEMAGLEIFADCDAKDNVLGTMTIGVGDLPDPPGGDTPPGDTTPVSTPPGTTPGATLPRTGGGDAMPVIALWALALGMLGAGALVWLPKRRSELL